MTELKEVPTEELLLFQDYPTTHSSVGYGDYTESTVRLDIADRVESGDVIKDEAGGDTPVGSSKSFWSVEYFQQFFDVDTEDVKSRILGSLNPKRSDILRSEMKTRPDLYGPFWISVTLVFTIAISGNVANYLQHANAKYHWKYDFHLVSYAASTIFAYVALVPLCLWGLFRYTSKMELDLIPPNPLELISIYGYSLFIYIPASILWTIQIGWLQWLIVLIATFISGSVLLLTLSPSLDSSRHKIILGVLILSLHLLLAAGFMLVFFHVSEAIPAAIPSTPTHAITIPSNLTKS